MGERGRDEEDRMLTKFWIHELTRPPFEEKVNCLVDFIRVWKTISIPAAFRD
jgi:hypothetical protein